jgi:hypothetical protein
VHDIIGITVSETQVRSAEVFKAPTKAQASVKQTDQNTQAKSVGVQGKSVPLGVMLGLAALVALVAALFALQ